MEVILLEKIYKLGNIGDKVNIKGGYCRNFLLPKGKVTIANSINIARFEARRIAIEKDSLEKKRNADVRALNFSKLSITIPARAGKNGKLFGSISPLYIAKYVSDNGYHLDKKEVRLPKGGLRNTGDYTISIHLYKNVKASLNIKIIEK